MKFSVIFLGLFFASLMAAGQLSFQLGEQYLSGVQIKKVIVTHDDRTVWVLSKTGQVYVKKATDSDFSLYGPTQSELVDDLSGYNGLEMYFSVKPKKLLLVKNDIKQEIILSDPQIGEIRNISVVLNGTTNVGPLFVNNIFYQDWLAIATDKYLYKILRGESTETKRDLYNQPYFDIKDYSITRTGIKGVEFKAAFSTTGRCSTWESDYSVIKSKGQAAFLSIIPDRGDFGQIRCTLFDYQSEWSSDYAYDFWGTDQALYVKSFGQCNTPDPIKTVISGKINSLEAIYKLTALEPQTFVMAATDNGFYYTPLKIYENYLNNANKNLVNFISFDPLSGQKINNLCTEYTDFVPSFDGNAYPVLSMCEKIVWLATDQGVKKLYVLYEGQESEGNVLTNFHYDKPPLTETADKVSFSLCSNESVEINSRINQHKAGALLIQWYKDGIVVPDLAGKIVVKLTESGEYEAKFTAVCEGVSMRSKIFNLLIGTAPEVTFNYPAVITLCEGQDQELRTIGKPNYTYRWFKDGAELPGITQPVYNASEQGKYKVEVSNCTGGYVSSDVVQINILTLAKPVLSASKTDYCEGEITELRVNSATSDRIQWLLNGVAQVNFDNAPVIHPVQPGSYIAILTNENDCERTSDSYVLKINAKPFVNVSKTPDKLLCYGERATLSVPQQSGYTYLWNSGEATPSIVVTRSGKYSVTVTNPYGCSTNSDEVLVVVNQEIVLAQPQEYKLCTFTGEELVLSADGGYKSYTWNGITSGEHSLRVNSPGNYTLEIEDAVGCKAIVTFKVIPWCNQIVVYNAFSPNGDGKNDVWIVSGLESDPGAKVTIHNRFGILVHQTSGVHAQWDGKIKGSDAPIGIYYYVITSRQNEKPLKGSVTLLR